MQPSTANLVALSAAAVVAAIGVADGALGGNWDAAALFAALLVLLVMVVVRARSRRPPVPVRGDLVAWLRRRASETGEPAGTIADRAIATYRAIVEPPTDRRADEPDRGEAAAGRPRG